MWPCESYPRQVMCFNVGYYDDEGWPVTSRCVQMTPWAFHASLHAASGRFNQSIAPTCGTLPPPPFPTGPSNPCLQPVFATRVCRPCARSKIAVHYLQTYFVVDIVSLLPFGTWVWPVPWTSFAP